MTLYSLILFFHVTAALGLFASLSFEFLSLSRLRRASDRGEVRRWIDPAPGVPLVAIASIFVVLFSGIYLAARMSAFNLSLAEGSHSSSSADCTDGSLGWKAYAPHPSHLGRSNNDEIRFAQTAAGSVLEEFA